MSAAVETLIAGDCRLEAVPAVGGAIARCTWRGIDLLRPAPQDAIDQGLVRQMACYPLVPWSNRIAHARFEFRGVSFVLRPNFPPEPHAIHGVGWRRSWSVADRSPARLALRLEHRADDDWPFPFRATQRLALGPASLELALEIENTGDELMPAGIGFHPFFPSASRATLHAPCRAVWRSGPDRLPVALDPVPAAWDFSAPRPAAGLVVDHCFTGWTREAALDYGDHRVVLRGSEPLGHLVIFAPGDGRDFIAIEPVSHASGALGLAGAGVAGHGLRVLAPGERLAATMTIAVQA